MLWVWPMAPPRSGQTGPQPLIKNWPDGQAPKSEPLDADSLVKLAESAVDVKASEPARALAARRLPREIARFVDGPRPRYQSRLAPLFELVEILSPAWDKEESGEIFPSH